MDGNNTSSIQIVNISSTPDVELPISFDNKYKGDDLTKRCMEILELPSVDGWEVVDSIDHLALVHYKPDADMNQFGSIRGLLLDLEVGAVIAGSFGYTPTVVTNSLTAIDGKISVVDTDGNTHNFTLDDCVMKVVFEGVVIRVLWHKGQLYRITHRKINPFRSRWGSAKSFITMYEEANGPTAEQLFDTTKPYSSTYYDFLVVDQGLLVGTRQKVTKPYIVCLAQRTANIKRPDEEVAVGQPTFEKVTTIGGSVDESLIHDPQNLSLDEANNHLKSGYYNEYPISDDRQTTGEAIIIYRMVNGEITDIVKVHSKSYDWRVVMRGNNPNIIHRFYELLSVAYPTIDSQEAWDLLNKKLIVLPLYEISSLKDCYEKHSVILTLPQAEVSSLDYQNRDDRIHLLWLNYVLSLPPHLQGAGLNILDSFIQDRNDVIIWIQGIESRNRDINGTEFSKRVKSLICSARILAKNNMAKGANSNTKGSYVKKPQLIKNTIRNLINKENGTSLYGLQREMKQARAPPTTN